jgi:septum site-determining protein MinD
MVNDGTMLDIDEIVSILAIDLLGVVPDDEGVIAGSNNGEPVVLNPNAKAGMAYRNIARRILGDSVPLLVLNDRSGFFSKMKKMIGL